MRPALTALTWAASEALPLRSRRGPRRPRPQPSKPSVEEDVGAAARRSCSAALLSALLLASEQARSCSSAVAAATEAGQRSPLLAATAPLQPPPPPPALLELASACAREHTPAAKRRALHRAVRAPAVLVPDAEGAREVGAGQSFAATVCWQSRANYLEYSK